MSENVPSYGRLVVIGTNGCLPHGNKARRKSFYHLKKRLKGNGVLIPNNNSISCGHIFNHPSDSLLVKNQDEYNALFHFDKKYYVIKHQKDENTDMFQIGRSTAQHIDIVLMDILPGSSNPNHQNFNQHSQTSTISRYSCRIICNRNPPYKSYIFAGCYDASRNMKISGPSWLSLKDKIDGFHSKNGVLIKKCATEFNNDSLHHSGPWVEVTASGNVYSLRSQRGGITLGRKIEDIDNELTDRTLIDLGGVTLLWRSENIRDKFSEKLPLYAVDSMISNNTSSFWQLSDFAFPGENLTFDEFEQDQKPWVFLRCGHVHGWINELEVEDINETETLHICPECRLETKHVPLILGEESSFYFDNGPISHCFVPCGHVCSMLTARYWWQCKGPQFDRPSVSICPFCACALEVPGFLKLIWLKDTYYNLVPKPNLLDNATSSHNVSLLTEQPSTSVQSPMINSFLQNFIEHENIDIIIDTVLSSEDQQASA